jgi:hypothetical protein
MTVTPFHSHLQPSAGEPLISFSFWPKNHLQKPPLSPAKGHYPSAKEKSQPFIFSKKNRPPFWLRSSSHWSLSAKQTGPLCTQIFPFPQPVLSSSSVSHTGQRQSFPQRWQRQQQPTAGSLSTDPLTSLRVNGQTDLHQHRLHKVTQQQHPSSPPPRLRRCSAARSATRSRGEEGETHNSWSEADLKRGEPELFVLLVCFAGDWEMHRRYGRGEKKETIPIYQLAGLHRRWRVSPRAAAVQTTPRLCTTVPALAEGLPCNFWSLGTIL